MKTTKILLVILAVTILLSALFLRLNGFGRKDPGKMSDLSSDNLKMVDLNISVYVVCDYLNNDGNRKTASSAVLDDIELRHDYESLMSSRTAKDLIQELNSLPDVWGDETDEIAYKIQYRYYDEEKLLKWCEKTGYGSFPENWSRIVSDINRIRDGYDYGHPLTYSTNIVPVKETLIYAGVEKLLPENVTLDQFMQQTGIVNSADIGNLNDKIYQFGYDYYDFGNHRITAESVPTDSDTDSLNEYAENHLDCIESFRSYSIIGSYKNYNFEIVRFDRFENWKENMEEKHSYFEIIYDHDDNAMDIYMLVPEVAKNMRIYVDSTNRFLIVTECDDCNLIKDFF